MTQTFSHLVLCFLLYSTVGWICETLYCSIPAGRFVKRGFLAGPYCPIYGVGAVVILSVCQPFQSVPVLVFLVSMTAAVLLEYFTGWLLEKLFQVRWWDYSGKKFQLGGRICLKNALLFGVMGVAVLYLVHPRMLALIALIPEGRVRFVANTLLAVFLIDLLTTVSRLTGFSQNLQRLQYELMELRQYNDKYEWFDHRDLEGSLARLRELDLPELSDNVLLNKLESVLEHRSLDLPQLRTYTTASANHLTEALESVRERYKLRSGRWSSLWKGTKRLGSKTVSAGKSTAKTVAGKLHYYELFWVFLIAGVLGYLVETVYCVVTTGAIESRQGLLYGPFNQVYGLGAVLMVVFLTPLARKNDRWVFFGSALLGGGFETLCSWIQEAAFGSVSWHYTEDRFAVAGGRTSLLFMFFWGLLGLWFIKGVYPWLLRMIERIPRGQGRELAGILSVLLAGNMLLSAAAVLRWSERSTGTPDDSKIGAYLDQRYPDEFMETVYPNMLWPEP